MQAKTVNASMGWNWLKCGWNLFARDFGTWFLMFILLAAIGILLSFIPLIGSIALTIMMPVFMGSYMSAARTLDTGGSISAGSLFLGFRDKSSMNRLLILGLLYVAVEFLLLFVVFSLLGGPAMMQASEDGTIDPSAIVMTTGMGFGLMLAMLAGMLVVMAFLFAPALVTLDGLAPVEAIKASFSACLSNILPMLLFGLIYTLLAILALLPMGLGYLILIPVTLVAVYCAYQSIFH
jgi:uncharacterized membrane protein